MRMKSLFAGIALACLSVSSAFAAGQEGPWVETKTPLTGSSTYTGAAHYLVGIGQGGSNGASFFGVSFYSDQAGTGEIDVSDDGSTWTVASTLALTAGNTNDLSVPIRSAYYRAKFVNGSTNQGAFRVFANINQSGAPAQTVNGTPSGSGGGGGGGGDASAANQSSQITQATATNTVLGGKTDAKNAATDATSISFMQVWKEISFVLQALGASPPTATNQASQLTQETASAAALGTTGDSACATDNGNCSIPALIKRGNQNATTLNTTAAAPLAAGSAIVGKVGIDQTTPGTTNAVQIVGGTTGGATAFGPATTASANSTLVSTGAHTLLSLYPESTSLTVMYLRLYDSASAPTCSSATGYLQTIAIPPAAASGLVGGIAVHLPQQGIKITNGLGYCVTGGPTSTDNTNATTGGLINGVYQ